MQFGMLMYSSKLVSQYLKYFFHIGQRFLTMLNFRSVVCDYHGHIECTVCAPAIAQRQAFTVCDFGCQGLELRPVEGCHLPYGALSSGSGDTTAGETSIRLDTTTHLCTTFG